MKVAIIVGRFQAHYLHIGHQNLLHSALKECDRAIVFIGTSIVRSDRNPLSYDMVKAQIKTLNGGFEVYELKDKKTDKQWLDNLFGKVEELTEEKDEVIYYGSRDSFLNTLPEGTNIVNIEQEFGISATNLRGSIQNRNSRWFLEGYIKAVLDEFPAHYAVVDAIITDGMRVLLGKKKSGYCLIGGFADAVDENLEAAAIREVKEETGLLVARPVYFTSQRCNDWRYRSARQPFTTVFSFLVDSNYIESAEAADDLSDVKVVFLEEIENYFEEGDFHLAILQSFRNFVKSYYAFKDIDVTPLLK